MATLDWPAGDAFRPAAVAWSARTLKSGWRAFYTGQRQSVSHLADRLRCRLTLPPVLHPAWAAQREAFLMGLASEGHWVRMGHFARPLPVGTARGELVLGAAAGAGSRTLSLAGAMAAPNELRYTQAFDASYWSRGGFLGFGSGSQVNATTAPDGSNTADLLVENTAASTFHQVFRGGLTVQAGMSYTASVFVKPAGRARGRVLFGLNGFGAYPTTFYNLAVPVVSPGDGGAAALVDAGNGWWRVACTAVATANHSNASWFWQQDRDDGAGQYTGDGTSGAYIWGAQWNAGGLAPYAGLPTLAAGDVLGLGGQDLVQVAHPGAVLADTGSGFVPLVLPLQKAAASGATVTWNRPTCVWELVSDDAEADYSSGRLAGAVELEFAQVVA